MIQRWILTLSTAGISVALLWFAVPSIISAFWPSTYYIRGQQDSSEWSIVVESAPEGGEERVLSDRVIVRDHVRDLFVTVVGIDGPAKLEGYLCDRPVREVGAVAGGASPSNMTLRRFMGEYREPAMRSEPCGHRPPGTYSVSVRYVIHGPLGSRIQVTLPSATFDVRYGAPR
jgi:hypothetical protein